MVIIVGTSHTIQTVDLSLKDFLLDLCKKFKVSGVAEEMSEEALSEKNISASIPMRVADVLQLRYQFCDPNREQRTKKEIYQENEIRIQEFCSMKKSSESKIKKLVEESCAMREQYWLERLNDFDVWPVLFVCGADHVLSFSQLLEKNGISMYVAEKDWMPINK